MDKFTCPKCGCTIPKNVLIKAAMSVLGSRMTPARLEANRRNAKKGGWPKGRPRKPVTNK